MLIDVVGVSLVHGFDMLLGEEDGPNRWEVKNHGERRLRTLPYRQRIVITFFIPAPFPCCGGLGLHFSSHGALGLRVTSVKALRMS